MYKTLAETVFEMVQSGRQNTSEFQQLLRFYGRPKLRELYLKQKEESQKKRGLQMSLEQEKASARRENGWMPD